MASGPGDLALAVGDGARRMTYAELAAVRGISLPSARRLVLRHHWPRQTGNDGVVRVTVPLAALARAAGSVEFRDTVTPATVSHATDPMTGRPDTASVPTTDPVTLALDSLREQLAIANGRADRAEELQAAANSRADRAELRAERAELQAAADRARIAELQAALGEERRRVIEILTRSRWRRWFR